MLLTSIASDESGEQQSPPVSLEKCEEGKIRFLAGWVVFKEMSSASHYTTKNAGSAQAKVKRRLNIEMQLVRNMKTMVSSRDEILRITEFPDSLQHIENYNCGGLTHVQDELFLFLLTVETACQQTFKIGMIEKYRGDAVRVARQLVRENPEVKIAWRKTVKSLTNKVSEGKDILSVSVLEGKFLLFSF